MGPSDAEKYGYGTLSVFIISICPILSVGIVSFRKSPKYKYVIGCMLGLCVGSLVGDSLLHLIPHVLVPHSHSHDHTDHNHTDHDHTTVATPFEIYHHYPKHESGDHDDAADDSSDGGNDKGSNNVVWKMFVAAASVWLFLMLQMAIRGVEVWMATKKKKTSVDLCGHNNKAYEQPSTISVSDSNSISLGDAIDDELDVHADPSVAWMLTIGDGLHNFTDGLAIGASFANSNSAGLATSIAVFCHELPHEFGDAALMLSAGWSYKTVLLLQFLSQVTAFVGLYIGISLSDNFEEAQMWIFCIAAGMFLYVGLTDAVPEILELTNHYKSVLIAVLANVGMAVGYTIMILLSVFEEKLHSE